MPSSSKSERDREKERERERERERKRQSSEPNSRLTKIEPQPMDSPTASQLRGPASSRRGEEGRRSKSYPELDTNPRYDPTLNYNPADYPPNPNQNRPLTNGQGPYPPYKDGASSPSLALRLGPESRIPDDPSSVVDGPTGILRVQSPTQIQPLNATVVPRDIKAAKASAKYQLGEFAALLRQRREGYGQSDAYGAGGERALEERLRWQRGVVVEELKGLVGELKLVVKEAEGHRWRRWLIGGAMASFIPIVRRIFRRPARSEDEDSDAQGVQGANNTEYAFRKSRGLLARIRDGLFGSGAFAQVAFFVFAVMYVFSNEVTLRVAKTTQKRIRKLLGKIERGEEGTEVEEGEKVLDGWRWRVLLW